jgi:D-cysteine desulfhydrase
MQTAYPIFDRFPALRGIPRVDLCSLPSPVQSLASIADNLWIKRDDLNARFCGGNKVRALEFLLGGLKEGDSVVTVGGAGSTHILATALHTARLGVSTWGARWAHEMNPVAADVSSRIERMLGTCAIHMLPVIPILRARARAITHRSRYIPVGGSVPLGVLGHVNGALELAAQIENGELPLPERVVLPMGTGGTAAGLLLGFAIAGLDIELVGIRTGPRAFANKRAVLSLARKTQRLINSVCGTTMDAVHPGRMRVVHTAYGGGYGRPVAGAKAMKKILFDETGIVLDDTYTAKAWAGALEERKSFAGQMLFWYTFDPSCLTSSGSTSIPATATAQAMSITR